MERYDLGVIGGGTAGLVSAAVSAGIGARTALVEQHRMGGECLWTGCVPSKALIRSASVLDTLRRAEEFGIRVEGGSADFAAVMLRVHAIIAAIEPHDSPQRFRGLGVHVVQGRARFVSPHQVEVEGSGALRARRWIVATGSRTALPDVPGLAESGYLTHETVWSLQALPRRLVVLGAGPIGAELAQAFARLGSAVTLVGSSPTLLPREDPELSALLARRLEREGVALRLSSHATRVRREAGVVKVTVAGPAAGGEVEAEALLVATGRRANVEEMGLEQLGVETSDRGVAVDARLRSSLGNLWAAGDVVGPHRFTHVADYQARLAVPNALFRLRRRADYRVVPWCTYTEPEVARVGLSEAEARERWGEKAGIYRYDHAALDRGLCEGEPEGLTKLVLDPAGRLVGAHVVAPRAGETIHEAVLAVRMRLKLSELSGMIHVYPTYAESLKRGADAYLRARYSGGLARRVAALAVRWLA